MDPKWQHVDPVLSIRYIPNGLIDYEIKFTLWTISPNLLYLQASSRSSTIGKVNDNGDVIMSKSYMHYATLSFLYEFVNLSKYNLF